MFFTACVRNFEQSSEFVNRKSLLPATEQVRIFLILESVVIYQMALSEMSYRLEFFD